MGCIAAAYGLLHGGATRKGCYIAEVIFISILDFALLCTSFLRRRPLKWCKSPAPPPGVAGVGVYLRRQAPAGVARGGQARFPGLSPTSTRRTMPKTHAAPPALASLLDSSTAGELIPELARYGLQQLIELEASAVIGADRHERS